jgi:hypothetical protein
VNDMIMAFLNAVEEDLVEDSSEFKGNSEQT